MPASRRARAMILAPRSCPSRPGFATTTRIFLLPCCAGAACSAVPSMPLASLLDDDNLLPHHSGVHEAVDGELARLLEPVLVAALLRLLGTELAVQVGDRVLVVGLP